MSHFSTIKTQLKDAEPLIKALNNLGYPINQEEKAKLIRLFDEATQVLQESDDLRAGLRDTVKHIAEELDIKPTVLNKAIKIAYKNSLSEERDAFDDIEMIVPDIQALTALGEMEGQILPAEREIIDSLLDIVNVEAASPALHDPSASVIVKSFTQFTKSASLLYVQLPKKVSV